MQKLWIICLMILLGGSCNVPSFNDGGGTGNNGNTNPSDTAISQPENDPGTVVSTVTTPTPTTDPTDNQYRPCVLVEETTFNTSTDQNTWKLSYYYTPRPSVLATFTDDGVQFCQGSGCRAGIMIDLGNRDISGCPSMAFRVQGTVNYQSLGGAGYDNREAPIAVMIQYTDVNGVRHASLNAFNEGEADDRNTTRMFWWGFGYLNPTQSFFGNFTPNITAVEQSVKFDKTINLLEKLSPKPKLIHTITIEGSGWSLDSIVSNFAMKPLEAFADPEAPYRTTPEPTKPEPNKPVNPCTPP